MEERLPLYENDRPAGELARWEEGLHWRFRAVCAAGSGVRKVWLCSRGGGRVLLGTLAPEGSRWVLERRLAVSELRRQGCTGELWGEIRPGDWQQEGTERPPVSCADPVIARSLQRWSGGRWRRSGGLWRLSFAWQVGEQVPMEPLFCFAHTGGGELYYLLDGSGFPSCAYKTGQNGAG